VCVYYVAQLDLTPSSSLPCITECTRPTRAIAAQRSLSLSLDWTVADDGWARYYYGYSVWATYYGGPTGGTV
jgi:hypothetical protein